MSGETNSTIGQEVPDYHVSQEPSTAPVVPTVGQEVDPQNSGYVTTQSGGAPAAHFSPTDFGLTGAYSGALTGEGLGMASKIAEPFL